MKDWVSRSTFAYAAAMFAVLFAPLVGHDPNGPDAHTLSLFPDPLSFVLLAGIVVFAVRQSLQHRPAGEPRFRRGLGFASIVSAIAGVLYGIAVFGLAHTFFANAAFGHMVALGSVIVVWLVGSAIAAAAAFVYARLGASRTAPRTAGGGAA